MAKQANPMVIGSFVLGGLALLITGILIFGSGLLFAETRQYVAFFAGSLFGLNPGAPVTFRGVKIGSVTGVDAVLVARDDTLKTIKIQVTMEIKKQPIKQVGGKVSLWDLSDTDLLARLVDKHGLRAKLATQSILTGQLYVDLDFYANTAIRLTGLQTRYPEIPTVESGLGKLKKSIESLPLEKLVGKAVDTLEGIDRLVNGPEIKGFLQGAEVATVELGELLQHVRERFDPLADGLQVAIVAAQAALVQARRTLALEGGKPEQLAADLQRAADAATAALDQARRTLAMEEGVPGRLAESLLDTADSAQVTLRQATRALASAESLLSEQSPLRLRLLRMIDELTAAARSLRILADYLERHPEALLKGKQR
jgi:paraquat-inducible protein B